MLVVRVNDFRQNLKKYLDQATENEVVVQQGKKFFDIKLRTTTSSDPYFDDPENIAHIREGIKDVEEGRYVTLSEDEIKNLLGV